MDGHSEEFILTDPVSTTSGKIRGFRDETNQIHVFMGIPYAKPPTGSLRFRPTVPLDTPDTEHICTAYPPSAPQTNMPFDTLMCVEINYQSEDCLYMNIWRPASAATDNAKPVIVWFHPGACLRYKIYLSQSVCNFFVSQWKLQSTVLGWNPSR
ncbi:hypothetical protein RMCBS344292_10281 [Rhizopus microsporus]|nr:hypothetical protein RMCBS344292_10281 [Rhizopus microsporus]